MWIGLGNVVFHARSAKSNFPSAPRKRTFHSVRFRVRANDSRAVTHDSGLARPKAHARTFVADLPNLNDAFGDAYLGAICAAPYREGRSDSSNPDVASLDLKGRSEEHTSELQSLMRISYAVFCLKKKKNTQTCHTQNTHMTHLT